MVGEDIVIELRSRLDELMLVASKGGGSISLSISDVLKIISEIERLQGIVNLGYQLLHEATNKNKQIRTVIDSLLAEIDSYHRPNIDGRACFWCNPGDGSWPCVHRMILDELKEARD